MGFITIKEEEDMTIEDLKLGDTFVWVEYSGMKLENVYVIAGNLTYHRVNGKGSFEISSNRGRNLYPVDVIVSSIKRKS